MSKQRKRALRCGCCDCQYAGYQHWDYDNEYGLCPSCELAQAVENEHEWQQITEKVLNALSLQNQEKFKSFDKELQRGLILEMIEDGVIQYKIAARRMNDN